MKRSLIIILAVYVCVLATGLVLRVALPEDDQGQQARDTIQEDILTSDHDETEISAAEDEEEKTLEPPKLKIEDLTLGNGLMAESGDEVSVHYTGYFEDGEVFDTSEAPGRGPYQFTLGAGQVIEGWERGIPGMRVGGVRKLTVPAHLAYGESGFGAIPSNATLIFEIELLSVFE